MKWNNKVALQLSFGYTLGQLSSKTLKAKKCDEAASKFIGNKVPSGNHKLMSMKFKRMLESKPGNKSSKESAAEWERSPFFEFVPPSDETKKQRGPSVTLGDAPCLKKTRSILKDVVTCVEQFAAEQKITKEDALQMVVDECNRTWHASISPTKCTIPDVDATALVYKVSLSSHQYQMIRLCFLQRSMG